jgi:hypothetical protein
MQSNNNNASRKMNNTPAYKTFCKVCQDSGKSISEYTNHNVRDRSGKTTCPTLLAQECRNCYQRGHTVKYCGLLKAAPEPVKPVTKAKPTARAVPKNVFMVFDDDSESESENETKYEPTNQDTQFPALKAATLTTPKKPVLNYGTIIDQANDPEFARALAEAKAKSKALALAEEKEAKRQQDLIDLAKAQSEREARIKALDERIKANAGKKFSWADAESDSEGSDDEEEYVAPKKAVQKQVIEDNSAW